MRRLLWLSSIRRKANRLGHDLPTGEGEDRRGGGRPLPVEAIRAMSAKEPRDVRRR